MYYDAGVCFRTANMSVFIYTFSNWSFRSDKADKVTWYVTFCPSLMVGFRIYVLWCFGHLVIIIFSVLGICVICAFSFPKVSLLAVSSCSSHSHRILIVFHQVFVSLLLVSLWNICHFVTLLSMDCDFCSWHALFPLCLPVKIILGKFCCQSSLCLVFI